MKGKAPYNKGKKMAEIIEDYIHPFQGKTHTEKSKEIIKKKRAKQKLALSQLKALKRGREIRLKISKKQKIIKHCATCRKQMVLPPSKSYLKNCSWECFGIYQSKHRRGKKSAGYINGQSEGKYDWKFNNKLKEKIKKRDNYTCRLCKVKASSKELSVHHIDYDKNNSHPRNLVSLHKECHSKTNRNRDYWMNYFYDSID